MGNERKTEKIVTDTLRRLGYEDNNQIIIEPQRSDNPRINKLLKNASKSGNGAGFPEFIISFKDNSELLIVIECKANQMKHESKKRDKYNDYAVDGVLLYSSYLAKDFDVIAIAVSGELKKDLRISNFLHLKGELEAKTLKADSILSLNEYISEYKHDAKKASLEYLNLLGYSKELNASLHKAKIQEDKRSLLISGILIALNDDSFLSSFKKQKTAASLSKSLVDTVATELEYASVQDSKIQMIRASFDFIKTHKTLSTDKEFLVNLIDEINKKVNSFIKTYKYYDVIGEFYIEFLRYANNDKGLGIVLTPKHITDFFVELAGIDKSSIVYDNCCGTGGFLIAAMQKMMSLAKTEKERSDIKEKRIAGTEYQASIFSLVCSNMMLHGDGKTNIFNSDCFDPNVISQVKKLTPNVGFLNPPFAMKKDDIEELEFVLNNLECLEKNAICIALIPLNSVCAQSGKGLLLKEKIMSLHTVVSVGTLPAKLFYNSKVSTITCAIIIEAHKPHPKEFKTSFYNWKEDNFIELKHKGRIDGGNWENIRNQWVTDFINKTENKNAVKKKIIPSDEWCFEAHIHIDYSVVTEELFFNEVKKYIAYGLINGLTIKDILSKKMVIHEVDNKKIVPLHELFHISTGNKLDLNKLDEAENGISFVNRSSSNCGITAKVNQVNKIKPYRKGAISVALGGSILSSFVQWQDFYTGQNVSVLTSKQDMSLFEKIYYCLCIKANEVKYITFGREANKTYKDILVPSLDSVPEYVKQMTIEKALVKTLEKFSA
ncbi:N-6 DNA methylase [Undibacterium amnicola]|uniref:site-specific DNA-methyltransferase (adenine-specific) n=2 Tax=Undibacterium amnicola TaxID=1834038 RepID=A0ABR6XSN0_9BURK|nr:N-6 DNA methylase [Undibacterium amnicola]